MKRWKEKLVCNVQLFNRMYAAYTHAPDSTGEESGIPRSAFALRYLCVLPRLTGV